MGARRHANTTSHDLAAARRDRFGSSTAAWRLRRRGRLGEVGLLPGSQETLDEYVCQTGAQTHAVTLAPKTAKHYASLYDVHIAPHLGSCKADRAQLAPSRLRSCLCGDRALRRAAV
jgi:hypothetical protein